MFELAPNATILEKLSFGGMVTLFGLFMVFLVLGIIYLVICLMKLVFYKGENNEEKSESAKAVTAPVVSPVPAPLQTDDAQLVAAITAAICAYRGGNSSFKVVSFNKKNIHK